MTVGPREPAGGCEPPTARSFLSSVPRIFRADAIDRDDPYAAPGAGKGDDPAPPWTFRRAVQNLVWIYAFGLVFLMLAYLNVDEGDPGLPVLLARIALITVIGVVYLGTAWACDLTLPGRIAYIVGFVGLLATTSTIWGWAWVNYGVYVSVMIAALVPWRYARFVIVGWSVLILATLLLGEDLTPVYIAIVGVAAGLATGGGMEGGRIGAALNRAERRVSTLAVAAERERIGRDLHDILGHSLTAVSIKSGLAARLVDLDPAAAKAQIDEIEEIARQALADVRATASGFRQVRAATEVASAKSVLLAAGVESRTPSAIPPLADDRSEVLGYVVREAVTNIVRHAEATHCTIDVGADHVSISDDGRGFGGPSRTGSGLAGLRTRVELVGGRFAVESVAGRGTTVRAELSSGLSPLGEQPGTSRESATARTAADEPSRP